MHVSYIIRIFVAVKQNVHSVLIMLAVLASAFLSGCGGNPRAVELLARADSLMNSNADSALLLLHQYEPQLAKASEAESHYYQLLRLAAEDKAYIAHTSDSIVRTLISYYEKDGHSPFLPRVYYLAGRVYHDMQRMPEALEYYHKSLELMANSTDYQQQALTNSQIGQIYTYQELEKEAYPYFVKAYDYDSLANSPRGMVFDLRDIGNLWRRMSENDSALHYYNKAHQLALQTGNSMARELEAQLAETYRRKGEFDKAVTYIRKSLTGVGRYDTVCIYSIAADICLEKNLIDSAEQFAEILVLQNNLAAKEKAHSCLAEICQRRNNTNAAIQHIKLFRKYNEILTKRKNAEAVARVMSLYEFNKQEREISKLQTRNLLTWSIAIVSILAFIILLISFLFYSRLQRRKRLEAKRNFMEYQAMQERQRKSEAVAIQARQQEANSIIAGSSVFKSVKERLQKPTVSHVLSNDDWTSLEELVDKAFPDFTTRLMTFCIGMNQQQRRVSLCVKLGFKVSETAEMTAHSMQSVNSTRVRLYKKVMGKEGKAADWDAFLLSL